MKRMPAVLIATVAAAAWASEASRSVTLDVQKMTCFTCPLTVRQVLKRQPGVKEASAEIKSASARVTYDPALTTPEALARALTEAGFPARVRP